MVDVIITVLKILARIDSIHKIACVRMEKHNKIDPTHKRRGNGQQRLGEHHKRHNSDPPRRRTPPATLLLDFWSSAWFEARGGSMCNGKDSNCLYTRMPVMANPINTINNTLHMKYDPPIAHRATPSDEPVNNITGTMSMLIASTA